MSRRHCSTGLGVLALLLLLCGMFWPVAQCAEGDQLLAELKVAYIYNFTGFIEWPEAPAERPFVIGVIGDPAMEAQLRVLERDGKQVGGRRIEVRGYASPDAIGSCEILFIGASAADWLDAIVRRTAGKLMLLIGDSPGYASRGVAIELFRKPDIFRKTERLRFRINPQVLKDRGLKVSAQLYDVAEIVQ